MDLVTFVAACALGFRAELFVPLVTHDDCSASAAMGTEGIPRNGRPNIERWATYIAEAARRFSRPEVWGRAVMQAESRGDADATSPAGAIGLMQIMPETYAELRVRYGLSGNAYDPHDNIIAGTAYMSEMIELFGVPNFLAAYNAGPARLEDHLRRGRPLPQETQRYLAEIGELSAVPPSSGEMPAVQSVAVVSPPSNAPSSNPQPNTSNASPLRMASAPARDGQHRRPNKAAAPSELFVQTWSNRPAQPSLSTNQPSHLDTGIGGALFV